MSPRARLGIALLAAVVVIAGGLAWWQWPLTGPDPEARARAERIEDLREAIARERAALEDARSRQGETEEELRALRETLEREREELEKLRRQVEQARNGS